MNFAHRGPPAPRLLAGGGHGAGMGGVLSMTIRSELEARLVSRLLLNEVIGGVL